MASRRHEEHTSQVVFFAMVDADARTKHLPIFAVPNAARRSPRHGAWMKAEGLRAGVPDVLVCVPQAGEAAGLALEFKTATGRLTEAQQEWHELLVNWGWRVAVVRSAQTAFDLLLDYIGPEVWR